MMVSVASLGSASAFDQVSNLKRSRNSNGTNEKRILGYQACPPI